MEDRQVPWHMPCTHEGQPRPFTKENRMLLQCPHCRRCGEHARPDFFGDWVVCRSCELPFAWREARPDEEKKD